MQYLRLGEVSDPPQTSYLINGTAGIKTRSLDFDFIVFPTTLQMSHKEGRSVCMYNTSQHSPDY